MPPSSPPTGPELAGLTGDDRLDELRRRLLAVVLDRGYQRLPEPVELASGAVSRDFVDGKRALAAGADLRLACEALLAVAAHRGVEFDAVGGLTLGADPFAHGVAVAGDKHWFVVRKRAKERGTRQRIEGAELGEGVRVLVVEDVVTTGGSIGQALAAVAETGAQVVLASALVDRGERGAAFFADRGVAYQPLLTYRDLGIDPV